MKSRKQVAKTVYFGAILLLMLVMLCSLAQVLRYWFWDNGVEDQQDTTSKTVMKDGVAYFPRQDITVVLVAGIDQYGKAVASGSYNNHGAADMVMLLVLDNANEKYDILYLNRDTMLTMPVLGIGGKPAGTYFGQLALSHTYGTGLEDSCENVRKTVSDFLHGIQIDYYVAMNMDAVSILTDAVGGVTVNVTEDFSAIDPTIRPGTVKLNGSQAINYVRTRKDVGDQLNLSRITRQQDFVDSFLQTFAQKGSDDAFFFADVLESVGEYMVTDCTAASINNLYNRCSAYEAGEIYTPEGKNVMGEKYYEFYVEEEQLEALTLQLFYAPKK